MLKHNLLPFFVLPAAVSLGGLRHGRVRKASWRNSVGPASSAGGQRRPRSTSSATPRDVPGTPVSIRIPRAFTSPPLAEGAGDARRVKPGHRHHPRPEAHLRGLRRRIQVDGQWAYYCYVGVTNGPLQNVATQLRDELAKKFPGGMSDWTDVSCETPEGQTIQCRKLRLLGKQDLYYKDKDGKEHFPTWTACWKSISTKRAHRW